MQTEWLIIDGYSLLYRDPSQLRADLTRSRLQLIRRLEAVAGFFADRVTIVFDGRSPTQDPDFHSATLDIVFSPGDKTADTVIERMVHQSANPSGILVITSDRLERETVAAAGGQTMSCGDFLDQCERYESRKPSPPPPRSSGPTLGDFFPES
jgi:predicted RNA-binding protein with PIN domain